MRARWDGNAWQCMRPHLAGSLIHPCAPSIAPELSWKVACGWPCARPSQIPWLAGGGWMTAHTPLTPTKSLYAVAKAASSKGSQGNSASQHKAHAPGEGSGRGSAANATSSGGGGNDGGDGSHTSRRGSSNGGRGNGSGRGQGRGHDSSRAHVTGRGGHTDAVSGRHSRQPAGSAVGAAQRAQWSHAAAGSSGAS